MDFRAAAEPESIMSKGEGISLEEKNKQNKTKKKKKKKKKVVRCTLGHKLEEIKKQKKN